MGGKCLLVLALAACDRGPAVPVHLESDDEERAIASLDEAFAVWGADYEITNDNDRRGVLRMQLLDVEVPADAEIGDIVRMGSTTRKTACRITMWSSYEPRVLAHELGHAWLGPEHEPASATHNLMSSAHMAGGEDEITDAQMDEAADAIDRLLRCR